MIKYPNIDPIAIDFGAIKIHWYGIMYLLGFLAAWSLGLYRSRRIKGLWTTEQISDLIFYGMLGVLLGGRLGFVMFYDFPRYAAAPLDIFKVWEGGMSFHGATIGVIIAFILFAKKTSKNLFQVGDLILPTVPIGIGLGRLGNFINGELWGKLTSVPWAIIFPNDRAKIPRHPSVLYEFFMEGVVLFLILWIFSRKERPRMTVSGMFLFWYGIFRFTVEFVREPDKQIGYLAFDWLTMGQLLSIPMIFCGVFFLIWGYKKHLLNGGINSDDIAYLKKEAKKVKDLPLSFKGSNFRK